MHDRRAPPLSLSFRNSGGTRRVQQPPLSHSPIDYTQLSPIHQSSGQAVTRTQAPVPHKAFQHQTPSPPRTRQKVTESEEALKSDTSAPLPLQHNALRSSPAEATAMAAVSPTGHPTGINTLKVPYIPGYRPTSGRTAPSPASNTSILQCRSRHSQGLQPYFSQPSPLLGPTAAPAFPLHQSILHQQSSILPKSTPQPTARVPAAALNQAPQPANLPIRPASQSQSFRPLQPHIGKAPFLSSGGSRGLQDEFSHYQGQPRPPTGLGPLIATSLMTPLQVRPHRPCMPNAQLRSMCGPLQHPGHTRPPAAFAYHAMTPGKPYMPKTARPPITPSHTYTTALPSPSKVPVAVQAPRAHSPGSTQPTIAEGPQQEVPLPKASANPETGQGEMPAIAGQTTQKQQTEIDRQLQETILLNLDLKGQVFDLSASLATEEAEQAVMKEEIARLQSMLEFKNQEIKDADRMRARAEQSCNKTRKRWRSGQNGTGSMSENASLSDESQATDEGRKRRATAAGEQDSPKPVLAKHKLAKERQQGQQQQQQECAAGFLKLQPPTFVHPIFRVLTQSLGTTLRSGPDHESSLQLLQPRPPPALWLRLCKRLQRLSPAQSLVQDESEKRRCIPSNVVQLLGAVWPSSSSLDQQSAANILHRIGHFLIEPNAVDCTKVVAALRVARCLCNLDGRSYLQVLQDYARRLPSRSAVKGKAEVWTDRDPGSRVSDQTRLRGTRVDLAIPLAGLSFTLPYLRAALGPVSCLGGQEFAEQDRTQTLRHDTIGDLPEQKNNFVSCLLRLLKSLGLQCKALQDDGGELQRVGNYGQEMTYEDHDSSRSASLDAGGTSDTELFVMTKEALHTVVGLLSETPAPQVCVWQDLLLPESTSSLALITQGGIRAQDLEVVGLCIELMAYCAQHRQLCDHLLKLHSGHFLSSLSCQVLNWHHQGPGPPTQALRPLTIRLLRALSCLCVQGGDMVVHHLTGFEVRPAGQLLRALVGMALQEISQLDSASYRRCSKALEGHQLMIREIFLLIKLLTLTSSQDFRAALHEANCYWLLESILFRILNLMLPGLEDLALTANSIYQVIASAESSLEANEC